MSTYEHESNEPCSPPSVYKMGSPSMRSRRLRRRASPRSSTPEPPGRRSATRRSRRLPPVVVAVVAVAVVVVVVSSSSWSRWRWCACVRARVWGEGHQHILYATMQQQKTRRARNHSQPPTWVGQIRIRTIRSPRPGLVRD